MTLLQTLCQWLYEWAPAAALRESDDLYPLIETAHVLAICLAVGSILAVDLRLLGWVLQHEPVTRVTRALLPLTWCGFGLMVVTGVPLFAAEAVPLYSNPAFRAKLLLLAVAGLNALVFHRTVFRSVAVWADTPGVPAGARAFAVVSVVTWAAVIVAGRFIAVFHGH